jgi:penicillin-binding protein 1A
MKWLWYSFLTFVSLGILGVILGVGVIIFTMHHYGQNLPDYSALKDHETAIVTRLYAGDGHLMAEYAKEKRIFVPVETVPYIIKHAFLAAEDQNFKNHSGIDFIAVTRAMLRNFQNVGKGRRPEGASTITQQVAKNFLLTNEVSYERKIKEAILAYRIERVLTKDQILELYLNEIYLGAGTYGIAAASLHYFNKPLKEIEIHEAAYLAALPKAPNNYHPIRRKDDAVERRNWVLERMMINGYITEDEKKAAREHPLEVDMQPDTEIVHAPYFSEEVRRAIAKKYGESSLYKGGLAIRTTVDPDLQKIAVDTLREGLVNYDRRHGYRGPLTQLDNTENWQEKLAQVTPPEGMISKWDIVAVLSVTNAKAEIGFADGTKEEILFDYITWAREDKGKGRRGPAINSVKDVLSKGDVIIVDNVTLESGKKVWALRQVPEVNGAIIAMDPHTGRILAMQGGWKYEGSEFNRAVQAKRQPGSAFKPFVYLAALDHGFTPGTLVLDAPFVIDQGPGLGLWRPSNYSNEYYGPTPIRVGIEKSKNLMTVRLADYVGLAEIEKVGQDFGVIKSMDHYLSNALGSNETTLLRLTIGYAQLVNGGKKIVPTMIDRIQNRDGRTIFKHDNRYCPNCGGQKLIEWTGADVEAPVIPDSRPQVTDARHAYQLVSMMQGVVERGTGIRIRSLGRPLAGKTGTTNDSKDAWFIGFSPDLVVGVFAGFDEPRSLGRKETGSSVAVPIFKDFMEQALADKPPTPFRVPPGIRHVRINAETGARAKPGDEKVIWEAFVTGTEPTDKIYILDGKGISLMPSLSKNLETDSITGTGGLY